MLGRWPRLTMMAMLLLSLVLRSAVAGVATVPDAARAAVAVIVPEVARPYRGVFAAMVEGIEDRLQGPVSVVRVAEGNGAEVPPELRRREVRAVIALGRQGLRLLPLMDRSVQAVAGGVLSVPEGELPGVPVYTLAPDPSLLFARLKSLLPGVRRVIVVYDPRQNGWLMRLAREAARSQGLELSALEAEDLKSAVRLYQEVMASSEAGRDALWLPQDSVTVDDSTVLPLVLRASWNQGLAVFSSSVAHVKRGALFALYPDTVELGRSMAGAALAMLQSGQPAVRGVVPLRDVLLALNTRTAQHLGLSLGAQSPRIHLAYPEP